MSDVPKYPGLLLRNGTYYHQVRVPADIVGSYGRQFERRSLRTKSLREAADLLAVEDRRVEGLFAEHRRLMSAAVGAEAIGAATLTVPSAPVDSQTIALRHAADVADREYAERSSFFAELNRRMTDDGSAASLFRGEIVPLPQSDYLDHVLSDEQIEVHAALATILKVRLQKRIAALDLALTIGNFASVAPIVEAELPNADGRLRRQLSRLLMKAEVDALRMILRDAADVTVPIANATIMPQLPGGDTTPPKRQPVTVEERQTLSAVAKEWITEKGRTNAWVEKTRHEREAAVRTFIEICGDRLIGAYRKADAREFKEILFSIPPNAHKKRDYQGMTAREIAEAATAKGDPRASAKNVSLKMDAVASLFVWACANYDEVSTNPFEGTKPKVDKVPRDERDPFTLDELRSIFATAPFTGAKSERNWLEAGDLVLRSTGKFWVPLIALYTGARLMEIVQLRKGDVREENGVTFFDLNDEGDKRVKTRAAKRRIPVHPALVAAGLQSYVATIRRNEDRLFPDIAIGTAKNRSGPASKLFARLFEAANVKTGTNCFHSFRHTFEDACRAAHIEASVMNALQGHAEKGMAGRYGSGFTLQRLSAEIGKISFDRVYLPSLKDVVPTPTPATQQVRLFG